MSGKYETQIFEQDQRFQPEMINSFISSYVQRKHNWLRGKCFIFLKLQWLIVDIKCFGCYNNFLTVITKGVIYKFLTIFTVPRSTSLLVEFWTMLIMHF